MRPILAALGSALALAGAPAAAEAALWNVDALDGPQGNLWDPTQVNATAGDTVQWSWGRAGTIHNVLVVPPGVPPERDDLHAYIGDSTLGPPVGYAVAEPGEYLYYCSLHGGLAPGGMNGRIAVVPPGNGPGGPGNPGNPGNPGTPGTPGAPGGGGGGSGSGGAGGAAGQGVWLNPSVAPGPFEEGDSQRPALTGVRAAAGRGRLRLRFQVSEPGSVTVRVLRGRKRVKTARFAARAGANAVTVRMRAGRYGVQVRASDRTGLESPRWSGRVRISS